MKALAAALATTAVLSCGPGAAIGQNSSPRTEHVGPLSPSGSPPALTAAQKAAIFRSVTVNAKIKQAENFRAAVGARVPLAIELHSLPEGTLAVAPATRPYRYTIVANRVVLVDPGTRRVVEVIYH